MHGTLILFNEIILRYYLEINDCKITHFYL